MDQGNLTVGHINIGVVVTCLAMGELARVAFDVVLSSGHGRAGQSSI